MKSAINEENLRYLIRQKIINEIKLNPETGAVESGGDTGDAGEGEAGSSRSDGGQLEQKQGEVDALSNKAKMTEESLNLVHGKFDSISDTAYSELTAPVGFDNMLNMAGMMRAFCQLDDSDSKLATRTFLAYFGDKNTGFVEMVREISGIDLGWFGLDGDLPAGVGDAEFLGGESLATLSKSTVAGAAALGIPVTKLGQEASRRLINKGGQMVAQRTVGGVVQTGLKLAILGKLGQGLTTVAKLNPIGLAISGLFYATGISKYVDGVLTGKGAGQAARIATVVTQAGNGDESAMRSLMELRDEIDEIINLPGGGNDAFFDALIGDDETGGQGAAVSMARGNNDAALKLINATVEGDNARELMLNKATDKYKQAVKACVDAIKKLSQSAAEMERSAEAAQEGVDTSDPFSGLDLEENKVFNMRGRKILRESAGEVDIDRDKIRDEIYSDMVPLAFAHTGQFVAGQMQPGGTAKYYKKNGKLVKFTGQQAIDQLVKLGQNTAKKHKFSKGGNFLLSADNGKNWYPALMFDVIYQDGVIFDSMSYGEIFSTQLESFVDSTQMSAAKSKYASPASGGKAGSKKKSKGIKSKGNVGEMQSILNNNGASLTVDGKWGSGTQTAFINFIDSKSSEITKKYPSANIAGIKSSWKNNASSVNQPGTATGALAFVKEFGSSGSSAGSARQQAVPQTRSAKRQAARGQARSVNDVIKSITSTAPTNLGNQYKRVINDSPDFMKELINKVLTSLRTYTQSDGALARELSVSIQINMTRLDNQRNVKVTINPNKLAAAPAFTNIKRDLRKITKDWVNKNVKGNTSLSKKAQRNFDATINLKFPAGSYSGQLSEFINLLKSII